MSEFYKLYKHIIEEANLEKGKWEQIPTYKGVNKYYSEDHSKNVIKGDIKILLI